MNPDKLLLSENAIRAVTRHAKAVVKAVEPVVNRLGPFETADPHIILRAYPERLDRVDFQLFKQELLVLRNRLTAIKAGLGLVALAAATGAIALARSSTAEAKDVARYWQGNQGERTRFSSVTVRVWI